MFLLQLNIIHSIVYYGIGLVILAMLIRAIASWFRLDERIAFIRFMARITDPFIVPVRRIARIPSVMGMDLSYFVVWFLLITLQLLLLQALPASW